MLDYLDFLFSLCKYLNSQICSNIVKKIILKRKFRNLPLANFRCSLPLQFLSLQSRNKETIFH